MSWDLICLKAHEHRQEGDETYACLYKNLSRIEKENINALQYNVRVVPLPLVAGNGDNKQLVTMEEALFKVIVDLNESKVMFDIGGADAALPSLLPLSETVPPSTAPLWYREKPPPHTSLVPATVLLTKSVATVMLKLAAA